MGTPSTILVVDDDSQVLDLLSRYLGKHGYQVLLAQDGHHALAHLRAAPVDLCITDLVMPEREGVETIQAIRKDFPSVKIIAMSGAAGGSYLRVAGLLGAHAVLSKPFELNRLLESIQRLLAEPA